ncbi:hypothetical protein HT031_003903 [Scenedesmus sp. PABB004]|nr:hypothetical protein HT031_003903 [Scenedesmus sp. PABB004]
MRSARLPAAAAGGALTFMRARGHHRLGCMAERVAPRPQKQQHKKQQQKQQRQQQEWEGLAAWRARGVDARRAWGADNRATAGSERGGGAAAAVPLPASLVGVALQVLHTADPAAKAALTHRGWSAYCSGRISLHDPPGGAPPRAPPARPARPARPALVAPRHVPPPKASPLPLSAHLLHNLAHIELNAVDLAWDTVARFAPLRLPAALYEDFARVADDESRHFSWCAQRLAELGYSYGDMPAHDLLWQGAEGSAGDLGARLAVVPLSQEARGLDAGQRLAQRLVGAGDARSAAIVAAIAAEERAHVAVGVVWFTRLCAALGVDPPTAFRAWLAALGPELLKGPFSHEERQLAGLPRSWYDVEAWPEELAAAVVKPEVAAAARGRGLTLADAGGPPGAQRPGLPPPNAVPTGGAPLEALRQRLWRMVEAEAAAC